jgi:hypothetical protein
MPALRAQARNQGHRLRAGYGGQASDEKKLNHATLRARLEVNRPG